MDHVPCALTIMVGCSACLPVALPPSTWAAGPSLSSDPRARIAVHAEMGIAPLQLSEDQLQRAWDATLSCTFDRVSGENAWGAAVAGGPILHPWGPAAGPHTTNRLMPQLVGRLTEDTRAVAVRVILEQSHFVSGSFGSKDFVGVSHGEAGYGVYLEAGLQWGVRDGWAVTAGLTLRLPATIGAFCCIR